MFTYQITWLTKRGVLNTIDSDEEYSDYDSCWRDGISHAYANKIKTGSLCILRDGKIYDEITINV